MGHKGEMVAVAMSGGVDSSVCALLLKQQGYHVVGVSFDVFSHDTIQGGGPETSRIEDVQAVCDSLDIEARFIDLSREFETSVVKPFVSSYLNGSTPNPCILCNQTIKFGALLDSILEMGTDKVATGHHARVGRAKQGRFQLLPGHDPGKNQAYFLFPLTQKTMARTLFPIGNLHKSEVRELALQMELPVARKKDSQEICFIPDDDYISFLQGCTQTVGRTGDICLESGEIVGKHDGLHRYTVGQRKGLGVAWSHALYVVDKQMAHNRLVVGPKDSLARTVVKATRPVLTAGVGLDVGEVVQARIRYRSRSQPATIRRAEPEHLEVQFHEPVFGVAPGQALVLDDGEEILAGAWIKDACP